VAAPDLVSDDLLELAVAVATRAGDVLRERQGDAGRVTYKTSDTDPVSEADHAAERLITEALLTARPDDGVLGEEGADRPGTTGLRWVIDPIDGTVNYLYGHPTWSVSIACEDAEGSAVGVVHQPATGTTYTARRGEGAHRDGSALRVNDPVALGAALIGTGFSYDADHRRRQANVVGGLLPVVRDIRRIGSAALDLCMVAAGMLDGYFEDSTSHWDWAAGALIASEAGAQIAHIGDGLVAAGPALFDPLRSALTRLSRGGHARRPG
jgi:myo-inositol-1(or 4)-monophosphatase